MIKKGVENGAFDNILTITSVDFHGECSFVGDDAFNGCKSLEKINDDNVIEAIGSNAFKNTHLSTAKFAYLTNLNDAAFTECFHLKHIEMPYCESIPDNAFNDCIALESVVDKNISYIGSESFKECAALKNIYLNKCIEIGDEAFVNCVELNDLNLDHCTKIGKSTFNGCKNISKLTLSVCEEIGMSAFENCPNLRDVYVNTNNPSIFCSLGSKNVFCDCDQQTLKCNNKNIRFHFRADVIDQYIEDQNWSHYADNMEMIISDNQIVYTTNDKVAINISQEDKDKLGIIRNEYYINDKNNFGVIEFKDNLGVLNENIFKNSNNLTSVELPLGCVQIKQNSFENCTNLNKITFHNIKFIGDYAFKNCESLTSFTLPESLVGIGEGVFAGCKNITEFKGKFVKNNGRVIVYNEKLICVLPKDHSDSEGRLFNMLDISGSNTITRLGKSCFHGCENMIRVNISSNITSIGANVFDGCTNLYEVHLEGTNIPTLDDTDTTNMFKDARQDPKIFVPEDNLKAYYDKWEWYTVANQRNTIYPKAPNCNIIYYGDKLINNIYSNDIQEVLNKKCPNGQYYKILNDNDYVEMKAFENQSSITTAIIGDGIKSIGQFAFKNCKNLDYIYLSNNISRIFGEAFYDCSALTRIHIPYDIKNSSSHIIEDGIFYGCSNLKEFSSYYKGCVSEDNRCYIDKNHGLKFFAQGELSESEKSYTIPDNIVKINKYAFRGSKIEKITLKQSTTSIDDYAFAECDKLQLIENWEGVQSISNNAFSGSGLKGISLPSKLKTIGEYAFENCSEMYINAEFPDSVTTIGKFAFNNCTNFKCYNKYGYQMALTLGKITSINESTFNNCSSLTSVMTADSNITTIGKNAFRNCSNLEYLDLPNDLKSIGDSAFENCENYKGYYIPYTENMSLIIPSNVTSIGVSCFKNTGIQELRIYKESKLTEISNSAFYSCKKLKSTKIEDAISIKTIGSKAFMNCESLINMTLPSATRYIGDEAFYGCDSLSSVTLPTYLYYLGNKCFASIYNVYVNSTKPTFTKNGGTTSDSESYPFGEINTSLSLNIYIPEEYYNAYYNDNDWGKYKGYFIKVKDPAIEDYIGLIVCDTKGWTQPASSWASHLMIKLDLPSEWIDSTISFKVYDENDKLINHPGGSNTPWQVRLINTNEEGKLLNAPYNIGIGYGVLYGSLNTSQDKPANYVIITGVDKQSVKYRGEPIGIMYV